jgi:uncharacterized C2H2 Zn-finger protein
MKEIIKHGDRFIILKCNRCGCEFGLNYGETMVTSTGKTNYTTCPECDEIVCVSKKPNYLVNNIN